MDGQYGNGAIVADLAGLAYIMRGKDYDLLNLQKVQARLAQPPDQQMTHPETGTCGSPFDFPDLQLTPGRTKRTGHRRHASGDRNRREDRHDAWEGDY